MPTEKARGSVKMKRKREISFEYENLPKDEPEVNSCVPIAKKVIRFNSCNEVCVHLLEIAIYLWVKYILKMNLSELNKPPLCSIILKPELPCNIIESNNLQSHSQHH